MGQLTENAIPRMRHILVGIVLGRLKHNQVWWHCGTAHCVAGWNTVLYHPKKVNRALCKMAKEYDISTEEVLELNFSWEANDGSQARRDWGISEPEAQIMFNEYASLAAQIGMIEFLADGHRLTGNETWAVHKEQRAVLNRYIERYENKKERLKWAKKWDAPPRPDSEFVKELLATKATSGKEVLNEILGQTEVVEIEEVCTLPSSR